jgi:hypothetical protein
MEQFEILFIWLVICAGVGAFVWRAHCEKGRVNSDPGSVYFILKGGKR